MDLKSEVEYRLARWIFENIYRKGKINEETHQLLISKLNEECDFPTKCIEERLENIE